MTHETVLYENNPNGALNLRSDDNLSAFIQAVSDQLAQINVDGNQVSDNFFISTANQDGLERIGRSLDEPPRDGESTEVYRGRIRSALLRATSQTTIEQFGGLASQLLDTSPENISVKTTGDIPIVVLTTNTTIINESPFTSEQIIRFLNGVVPAAHAVEIQTEGSLVLGGPNFTPPDGSGIGEGELGGQIE